MKIYYEKTTGEVLLTREEVPPFYVQTTIDQDIATFKVLSERNRNTFDVLKLEFGKYAQDFAECTGYKVNPTSKKLLFSYGGEFMIPLSEQIEEMNVQAQLFRDEILNLQQYVSELKKAHT
jgi:hypothetical protein